MVQNQGHEIDKCNILDNEKRFMGFSWIFHGIFIKAMLVSIVLGQPVFSYTYKHNEF